MTCGVYVVVCTKNDRFYLGSSKNIEGRYTRHRRELKDKTHHSMLFQQCWDKYKECDFVLKLVEECLHSELKIKEQEYLDNLDYSLALNMSKFSNGGDNISQHPNLEDFKKLQSRIQLERIALLSEEERQARYSKPGSLNPMYGKKHTEKSKKLMAASTTVRAGSDSPLFGVPLSEARKQRLSEIAKQRVGNKNPFFGRHHSDETKAILALVHKGNKPANTMQVIVSGVVYKSATEAGLQLGAVTATILNRCRSSSKQFQNYSFKDTSND